MLLHAFLISLSLCLSLYLSLCKVVHNQCGIRITYAHSMINIREIGNRVGPPHYGQAQYSHSRVFSVEEPAHVAHTNVTVLYAGMDTSIITALY